MLLLRRVRRAWQGKQYGDLTRTDIGIIEWTLDQLCHRFTGKINVLEIGFRKGDTARGIRKYLAGRDREIEYWGVDLGKSSTHPFPATGKPFREARVVWGDSAVVYPDIPDHHFHFVFVDGCHCSWHVKQDLRNYEPKLMRGGCMAFHDTDPDRPKVFFEGIHGNAVPTNAEMHGAVRQALKEEIGFSNHSLKLLIDGYGGCDNGLWGGVMVYGKA